MNLQIDEAQKLLTRAQKIAQKYNLSRLAMKISMDHDKLLKQWDLWEEIKSSNAPISERLKMISLEDDLKRMLRKQQVEPIEIHPEEPLLISFITKEGVSLYNHFFLKKWEKKDLFNSFITAFNLFGNEIFSNELDRIKIGENTILMNSLGDIFICYVIKGQSFLAQ